MSMFKCSLAALVLLGDCLLYIMHVQKVAEAPLLVRLATAGQASHMVQNSLRNLKHA